MFKVGQKVLNTVTGQLGRINKVGVQHIFVNGPIENLYEVVWEDQYIGLRWETDLVPVPDTATKDQQQAIKDLLCGK